MNGKHVVEHLSSFIDGECEDAEYVARHLQSCQDCARRHMELVKLSNHLGALRGPDVAPDFAARVVAHVEDREKSSGWHALFYARPVLTLALSALAMTAGIGAWYQISHEAQSGVPVGQRADSGWLDDETVILAFRELLDSGRWENPFEQLESSEDTETPVRVEDLLDSLADWSLDDQEERAWYMSEDWLSVIDALSVEDVQFLDELTTDKWNEG
jgi:hypothetical protein